jgi:hypothetical protein
MARIRVEDGEKMLMAQDILVDASSRFSGGFNSRLHGRTLMDTVQGDFTKPECRGWDKANDMILEGKIFYKHWGIDAIIKVFKDGKSWCCAGAGFVDLQESDNYAFADTREKAISNFASLTPTPKEPAE